MINGSCVFFSKLLREGVKCVDTVRTDMKQREKVVVIECTIANFLPLLSESARHNLKTSHYLYLIPLPPLPLYDQTAHWFSINFTCTTDDSTMFSPHPHFSSNQPSFLYNYNSIDIS